MLTDRNRILLAFALNIAAGLSTCIGGLVILNRKLVSITNPSRLGIALGVSAGVMIFISLAEIFEESIEHFRQVFHDKSTNECDEKCRGHSKTLATICFMFGALIIFVIDFIIHRIAPEVEHELTDLQQATDQFELENALGQTTSKTNIPQINRQLLEDKQTRRSLNRTGILTALAIAIHNLPEGIATYIGALKNTRLGVMLAVSIALHNIPEGIAVAAPVYFATKSKLKAFLWTFVSALAEPLGGIICWAIVRDGLNPTLNGIMFGLVVGMMVTISFKELIPTAYRFCPYKNRVTYSVLTGMCLMALSLILFDYAGV